MRRRCLPIVMAVLLAIAFSAGGPACQLVPARPTPTPTATPRPSATPTPSPSPTPEMVDALVAGMSLEEKVGQLLLVGLPGSTVDAYARHAVVDLRVGGVVLVAGNAESPGQLQALLRELQGLARVPLFVAINHEGGAIIRVQSGVTAFPGAMALGAAGSPELAYQVGYHGAEELAAMGVNMNLAPVVDVNSEPTNPVIGLRSFGARPEAVGELGAQFVRGTQAAGVIAVAKHFPGHGAATVDSHLALPVLSLPADELWRADLLPFRRAVGAGVEAIMSAHVDVPALTGQEGLPATLSPAVMGDLLRRRLGFNGLAITDDLDMKGITGGMGVAEAAVRSVEAGADVVLVTFPESEDVAATALVQAVRDGRLSEARLDESVRHILGIKVRYGLFQPREASLAVVGSPEHEALARQVAEAAVTVVEVQGLPLAAGRRTLMVSPEDLPAGSSEGGPTLFGQEVGRRAPDCRELLYAPYQPASQRQALAQALELAGEYDQAIVGLWDASQQQAEDGDDTAFRLARSLVEQGRPVAVVAWQRPYDVAGIPPGVAALATCGDTPAQVQAAVEVLFGERAAPGTLPVPLR